jgi:beta-galactosidase
MWHINNEYTCHIHECYCLNCRQEFQRWLKKKYKTIANLNFAWSTKFWSQSYQDWAEIFLPEEMPTFKNPCQQLDYRRFISDMNLEIYQIEKTAIQKFSKNIPFMTNLMGLHKYVDGFKWASEMDVVSWNAYPNPFESLPYPQFLANDLMRSLKKKPFLIMEQAASAVNWRQVNGAKAPGQMRLWSYEALAHGSDGIMFFQWRQSQGGAEKFHSAMVPHGDPHESRIFNECSILGNELKGLTEVVGSQFLADIAIVFDWENWWALELDAKPNGNIRYIHQMRALYVALRALNVSVDFIHPSESLEGYPLVIAHNLYSASASFGDKVKEYVANGGIFLANFFSGIVNENDPVYLGSYPGLFKDVLGITVEEFYPLKAETTHQVAFQGKFYDNRLWEEVIHLNGATTMATFTNHYLKDSPAITKHSFGKGLAYYLGTELEQQGVIDLLTEIILEGHLTKVADKYLKEPTPLSVTVRQGATYTFLFLLNHTTESQTAQLLAEGYSLLSKTTLHEVTLAPMSVEIVQFKRT